MAKESELLLAKNSNEMENNNEFKTTTLSGQMVISQTESGVDMIQGLPDNPVPEQVKPFSCWGHMHMLSNGMFDFISRIRKRNKPKFKKDYVSLSFCFDGHDRIYITVPSILRDQLPKIIRKSSKQVIEYLEKEGICQ